MSSTPLPYLPDNVEWLIKGVVSFRSIADFQQICERFADWSVSEVCMLQPVFYMYLDPDRIPAKSTPAASTDIQLARWSFVGIVQSFNKLGDDSGPGIEQKKKLISAWNHVAPWLVFFHSEFIMCRANYRPVDRKLAIDLVGNTLHCGLFANNGNASFLATTPTLYRPIVELWLLALKIKDEKALFIVRNPLNHSRYGCLTPLDIIALMLATGCMHDKTFMTIVLEVSGDTGSVVSTALKYVKSVRLMAQDPDIVSELSTSLELIVQMFAYCVRFIVETSKHSAAMREEFILRQSVKEIFSTCRVIQLLSSTGSMKHTIEPSFWSFEYLTVLLDRANDAISVLRQALHAHAFETTMCPLGSPEADLKISMTFLFILFEYLNHDTILTYAYKHVDTWSKGFGTIARQHEAIREYWSALEKKTRSYVDLRSREDMMRRPSPNQKGWVLRCHCGGTAEDVQLRQCAGCQVVRYCSKRCQRDSWYSHHRWSCKFLKAAVGSSTPHYVKRSLCLLSALEVYEITRKWEDIQKLIADARRKYPQDQERLVVEVTVDKAEVLVQPLRHYLFLFNGLSEDEVVDSLSSWPNPRGHLHQRTFFCSVIAIVDRFSSRQILFSPRTALDMEIVPTLSRIR
ncbi:hypothetical protein DFH29DRAFT_264369 [Suillus ampliporus]|nr:hypothetical protein DFH29DRAFT_264369 [Suillus ampliporus]